MYQPALTPTLTTYPHPHPHPHPHPNPPPSSSTRYADLIKLFSYFEMIATDPGGPSGSVTWLINVSLVTPFSVRPIVLLS